MSKVSFFLLLFLTALWSNEERTIALESLYKEDLTIKDKTFKIWFAIDPKQRNEGLSHLLDDEVSAYEGMLFVYPINEKLSFWMKDTLFDLDLIYLDEHGKIINIYTMESKSLKTFDSSQKVRFALEVRVGELKKLNLEVGESIELSTFTKSLLNP